LGISSLALIVNHVHSNSRLLPVLQSPLGFCARNLSHAFTLCGTRLDFITEDTIAYRCGNSIAFLNIRTKAQSWLPIEEGYALDCFAVNFAQHLIVCGVHGKASRILIFQYGHPAPIQVIEGMRSMRR
jgi:hypothetical protein